MCKNPVGKFEKHVLTLRVSSSVANAMLQFEFNWLYIYINEKRWTITLYRVVNYWRKCNGKLVMVIQWEIFAKHNLNMEFIASLMCRSINFSWIIYWWLVLDNLEFKHKNWLNLCIFKQMLIMITWSLLGTVITWPITNLFMTLSLRKRSLTCYKADTRMDHIQSSSLYSRWRLVVDRDACAAFWKQT